MSSVAQAASASARRVAALARASPSRRGSSPAASSGSCSSPCSRGRRRRQRQRAPAEHPARPGRPRALGAQGRHRGLRSGLSSASATARIERLAREGARPRAGRSRRRRPTSRCRGEAQAANRRIVVLAGRVRVLLAVALARAFWLQAVNGDAYAAMAVSQHPGDRRRPGGARHDRRPERRAARDRRAGDHGLREPAPGRPAARGDARRGEAARRRARADLRRAHRPLAGGSSTSPARPTRWPPEELEKLGFAGLGFYPEELRTYPQGPVAAQVLGFAGLDNKGLEGLERSLEKVLAGRPGSQTIVKDPIGPRARRRLDEAGDAGPRRPPHARPPDPGERGGRAPGHGPPLRGEGGVGDRDGPAHRRRPRDGRRARVQREPLRDDAPRPAAQPRGHGHLRAGLDLQARHGRGGARRRAW